MDCGEVRLSTAKIDHYLQEDYFEPGTRAYEEERRRRYRPAGRKWVEREDWDPSVPPSEAIYSGAEVKMIILRLEGGEPWDGFDNARHRLFVPCGAGLDDDRWIKRGKWLSARKSESTTVKPGVKPARKVVGKGFAFVGPF